jgi:hypothetical protein
MRHLATVTLCGTVLAQGPIFVVDAGNGAGTNFTQIQAAIAAVPDGSTLVVRAGTYTPVTIDAKGLTILGVPGATFVGAGPNGMWLDVRNILASQAVTVRGLQPAWGPLTTRIGIDGSAGPVTVDGAGASFSSTGPVVAVTASSQVGIRDWTLVCNLWGTACTVDSSVVVMERCALSAAHASPGYPTSSGYAALQASNSEVQLVHTSARGGNGIQYVWHGFPQSAPAGPAVRMASSSLRATGLAAHVLASGIPAQVAPLRAVEGSGVARIDPQITVSGSTAAAVQLTRPSMPSLLASSAAPGATMTVERYGPAGVLAAIAISLRGAVWSLPPLPDPLWLDPATLVVEAVAVTTTAPLITTLSVPNQPALVGFQCVWQAADLDATGLLAVSNPSPSFVR